MSVMAQRRNDYRTIHLRQPRVRKSERTHRAIVDAATGFLRDRPFRDLTVAELMSRAGASRAAFYQYFTDLHELMETLLDGVRDDILESAKPWFEGEGDATALLLETQAGMIRVCLERGPILRAVADAAPSDEKLERVWAEFMGRFDDAVAKRISEQQAEGLIPAFPAMPVAVALNRMNASMMIEQFGSQPQGRPEDVQAALARVWISTLYGHEVRILPETTSPPKKRRNKE